ncbi:hypothetical protein [Caballeronia sp.]|jgi:5,5'-dehydrodivanillate O-demethylase oxygenase subunit|uniref:hypothetical protein n=1 Tax=Caballeronia sp. TaxID=1931223 RepID=UPI0026336CA1|nr:hypothetical protein [Caballeronia sp.]
MKKETKTMFGPAMDERVTRVGPRTPGGKLMRRYWIPIAPYSQFDDNPVRVLGANLVLSKDNGGKLAQGTATATESTPG